MSNDRRDDSGPLGHFRIGRRAVLSSLASGVGVALTAPALAETPHAHHAAASAGAAAAATAPAAESGLLFLDAHAFETLSVLGEQIVPGARAEQVPQFLDRLLAVESTETQKRFSQALGAFEHAAREAHGKSWKALSEGEATALLTRISSLPADDSLRRAFDGLKDAVARTYYSTEAGMKELGWNRSVAFAPPTACTS